MHVLVVFLKGGEEGRKGFGVFRPKFVVVRGAYATNVIVRDDNREKSLRTAV
jgi:hypothetical protein